MNTALLSETKLTLPQAARLFPGHEGNEHINHSSLWRYAIRGHRLRDGRVVKLEAFRLGARWYTTREAIERFVVALNQPAPELAQA